MVLMCNIAKKGQRNENNKDFLHTVYIICYTIFFYLHMLNNNLTSLKSNPYSECDSIADISVSSVAMLFEE